MKSLAKSKRVCSAVDMAAQVEAYGLLPIFVCAVPGFSIEEMTPTAYWFASDREGPWEWKGPVIRSTHCVYGKFFASKAGFIMRDYFVDFANYRRDGYDLDARYEDGLLRREDKRIYDILTENAPLVSRDWRHLAGVSKRSAFDAVVTRLEMLGYVATVDFKYAQTRSGQQYGWGLALYSTPEQYYGDAFKKEIYRREPQESYSRLLEHLSRLLPQAKEEDLRRLLK